MTSRRPPWSSWAYAGVEVAGAALLIAATSRLPWATYRLRGESLTHPLHADLLWPALIATAVVVLVAGVLQMAWQPRGLAWAAVLVSVLAFVLTVVEAAKRIALANSLTDSAGGVTKYASGSGVAVLGALSLLGAATAVHVIRSRY